MSRAESLAVAVCAAAPGIVVKATVVLVAAMTIAFLARRSSAARRHLIWLCALSACAALVIVSPMTRPIVVRLPAMAQAPTRVATGSVVPADAPAMPAMREPWRVAQMPQVASRRLRRAELAELAVAAWVIGVVVLVVRFVVAYRVVARIVGNAQVVETFASSVAEVRISDEIASPFTFRMLRPSIVLPTDFGEWTDARRTAVLRHEAAHVERGDAATQTVGLFACALLWFHPLAWLALARLRAESENAADDRVIEAGMSSIEYAGHLLELARASHGVGSLPLAVGMATPPLETRVRAIVDRTRSRSVVSTPLRVISASCVAAAMLPLGGLQVSRAAKSAPKIITTRERPSKSAPGPTAVLVASTPSVGSRVEQTVIASIATDSAPATPFAATRDTIVAAPPVKKWAHPDFSGTWVSRDSTGAEVGPDLVIGQTATSFSLSIERRATDEFGRFTGWLKLTTLVEDGQPPRVVAIKNGMPVRIPYFATSWEGDTLESRLAVPSRRSVSGSVERTWLTADGKGLVINEKPFGYLVNSEGTDTLWRKR
ncbi:MAG TPA: M56 family metallopeptidase [Gemmatimonadaceae bacterium]|jgi:beta-lactamase regulating signal transducer with metallopeptidase domain